jgi:hypothetical protein
MRNGRRLLRSLVVVLLVCGGAACGTLAPLAQLIQPPRFQHAADRQPEIRFMPPTASHPTGGAGVTLWVDVTNPNPFGFTLSTLDATLMLDGSRAATGTFPLGLPLQAAETTTIPVDLNIGFADIPGLANAVRQIGSGGSTPYQLDGTIGVDAGRLGQPTFGPMRLAGGELRVMR